MKGEGKVFENERKQKCFEGTLTFMKRIFETIVYKTHKRKSH